MNRVVRIALSSALAGALLCASATSAFAALKIAGPTPDGLASPAAATDTPGAPLYATDIAPGTYPIDVASSSSMFRIVDAQLTVADDAMTCTMTMSGSGYGKLFMGTAEQAQAASKADCIPFTESAEGTHVFTVPVEALNADTDCAAWSIKKERWYDRVIVFESGRIPTDAILASVDELATRKPLTKGISPEDPTDAASDASASKKPSASQETTNPQIPVTAMPDGTHLTSLALEGGSGKASVESPSTIVIENGTGTLTVTWSSPNYTRMIVDGTEYPRVNSEGNSVFEIPVAFMEGNLAVSAETVAMGSPHMVDYTLRLSRVGDDTASAPASEPTTTPEPAPVSEQPLASHDTALGIGWTPTETVDLQYARTFALDRYEGGYTLITLANGDQYLVVPEGASVPEGLSPEVVVVQRPLTNVYLVASNALCLVDAIGAVDSVGVLGVKPEDVSVASFADALANGSMVYGGKYNAPDYELILAAGSPLAIESTMINHNPEVKEKLETLGIPVLTETSSYENSPLGRLEWIKLYGALFGAEQQAAQVFDEQAQLVQQVSSLEPTGKTAAFFYINSNGAAVTRRPGDYIAQMIELAGGTYAFDDLQSEGNSSSVTLEMEEFYARAKDVDVIIYNSTIDGGVSSLEELVAKNPLLAQCKAVQEGNVWCTDANMYQQMTATGTIIADLRAVLDGTANGDLTYLYRLD